MNQENVFNLDKMYCGHIRRGDVVLFEDERGGEKAGVVLQDDILNERLGTVLVALIEPYGKGERVFKNETALGAEEIGLGKDGLCLLHKIFSLDRRKIAAKKGELKKETLKKVYAALDLNLGRFRD